MVPAQQNSRRKINWEALAGFEFTGTVKMQNILSGFKMPISVNRGSTRLKYHRRHIKHSIKELPSPKIWGYSTHPKTKECKDELRLKYIFLFKYKLT